MKTVVITGASTGIGRVAAEYLASQGWRVFAGIRKLEDGAPLVAVNDRIRPILLDVTDTDQIEAAVATVDEALKGRKLDGLVNNAGIAFMAPLALQDMEAFKAHFDVNVFGLLQTTKAFLPLLGMTESRDGAPGRIVNISSSGGVIASPFLGAYTATKHAVESLTDSLRRELVVFGIDAISVGPGAVKTPIWDKAEDKNKDTPFAGSPWETSLQAYQDVMLTSGRKGLEPVIVAKVIERALTAKSPKARYAPVPQKFQNLVLPRLLPKRVVDKAFWKRFGIRRG